MYKDKVYVYTVIQADEWSIQYMYKDKVYVYTFIQADDWSYTVVDV
jgi:hypothetical protein